LRDSGVEVLVAQRPGGKNHQLAIEHNFRPISAAEAAEACDLIIMAVPDELAPALFQSEIAPKLKPGKTLGFTHGFNIQFGLIQPPEGVEVVMIGPKGPGHLVRSEYVKGGGVPCLVAVARDVTG